MEIRVFNAIICSIQKQLKKLVQFKEKFILFDCFFFNYHC